MVNYDTDCSQTKRNVEENIQMANQIIAKGEITKFRRILSFESLTQFIIARRCV